MIISTQEAKIRELLEDEDEDFLSEGVRALVLRSPTTTTTGESKEVAPGEFIRPVAAGGKKELHQSQTSSSPISMEETEDLWDKSTEKEAGVEGGDEKIVG
jgi:hypothetical protein